MWLQAAKGPRVYSTRATPPRPQKEGDKCEKLKYEKKKNLMFFKVLVISMKKSWFSVQPSLAKLCQGLAKPR